MLSAILGYKAWRNSRHAAGTVEDADFWLLVQGCMMQLLGLLVIIFPLMVSACQIANKAMVLDVGHRGDNSPMLSISYSIVSSVSNRMESYRCFFRICGASIRYLAGNVYL